MVKSKVEPQVLVSIQPNQSHINQIHEFVLIRQFLVMLCPIQSWWIETQRSVGDITHPSSNKDCIKAVHTSVPLREFKLLQLTHRIASIPYRSSSEEKFLISLWSFFLLESSLLELNIHLFSLYLNKLQTGQTGKHQSFLWYKFIIS